jgi:hypothetical protein
MLEFYSVHSERTDPIIDTAGHSTTAFAPRVAARKVALAIAFAMLLGGCATAPIGGPQAPSAPPPPAAPPMPRNAEPPPPPINLSGFPLPYRQGYADGCASAAGSERKDVARFAGDPNYRTGWQDGIALCRKK